jgi:hypothetical protein
MLRHLNPLCVTTQSKRPRRLRRRGQESRQQPALEMLERRVVLSTLTVLNNADSGPGSLRAEIAAASSGDMIVFAPALSTRTITLTSGELVVNKSVNIAGVAAQNVSVSGNHASRVFHLSGDAVVSIHGLSITSGSSSSGGAVLVQSGSSLTLTQCSLNGNEAVGDSNGNALGGAIWNQADASLTILQSALSGNETNGTNES